MKFKNLSLIFILLICTQSLSATFVLCEPGKSIHKEYTEGLNIFGLSPEDDAPYLLKVTLPKVLDNLEYKTSYILTGEPESPNFDFTLLAEKDPLDTEGLRISFMAYENELSFTIVVIYGDGCETSIIKQSFKT